MLMTVLWIVVLAASLYALVRSAEYFVSYCERLWKMLRMSPFIVGVVIVSVGTALPEFSSSVISVAIGKGQLIFGIMLGTVIANILLLLGIASVSVKKEFLKAQWDFTLGDFPAFIFTVFLVCLTLFDGELTWPESVLFLLALIVFFRFLYFAYKSSKETMDVPKEKLTWKMPLFLLLSLAVLLLSARFSLDSIVNLAGIFNIGESVLVSSVMAIGTSLPELSTIMAAVKKKNYDLAFGNAIGASVFGMLIVFGISGFFGPIAVPPIILTLVLPTVIIAAILFWVILQDKQITRYEGWFMLIIYALFIMKLFNVF
jgi:cation:H+ antiporter